MQLVTLAPRAATRQSLSRTALAVSRRSFGNAPSRVRPVEVPMENALRQTEREVSATIVVIFIIAFPLWLFVLSAGDHEKKRESVKTWALEQRALHRAERLADEADRQ